MGAWDAEPYDRLSSEYRHIEGAASLIEARPRQAPGDVAAGIGLDDDAFRHTVARWAGTTAERFLRLLAEQDGRTLLEESARPEGSGSEREFSVSCDEALPGSNRKGHRTTVAYGLHPSPFGQCVLAVAGEGVCGLAFECDGGPGDALQALRRRWAGAELVVAPARTRPLLEQVFAPFAGREPAPLRLHLVGTRFQMQVWQALLRIPSGEVISYGQLAAAIGMPRAARAVGQAVGLNPIAYLIPCHRVVRRDGALGGYRWGTARKRAMLAWEAAHRE